MVSRTNRCYIWKFIANDPAENLDLIRREREEKTVNYQFNSMEMKSNSPWDSDSIADNEGLCINDAGGGIRGFYTT